MPLLSSCILSFPSLMEGIERFYIDCFGIRWHQMGNLCGFEMHFWQTQILINPIGKNIPKRQHAWNCWPTVLSATMPWSPICIAGGGGSAEGFKHKRHNSEGCCIQRGTCESCLWVFSSVWNSGGLQWVWCSFPDMQFFPWRYLRDRVSGGSA